MSIKKFVLSALIVLYGFFAFGQNQYFTTKLPIVFINTDGQEILDNPRIVADLEIAWKENDEPNNTNDAKTHFNGKITIEIRGSSSQMFPKKSYGFELKDSLWEDMDFPLLGMPEEEDWILYAPYSDKSLIRNVLTFSLANQLGNYVPQCRFVELFVNNEYVGIYVLMEKIKRDKNRVDIAKLKVEDIDGEELTGGYIIKIDKTTGSGGDGWFSEYFNKNNTKTFYQYEYPDTEDIQSAQKEYIQNYINEFETAVYYEDYDAETGYPSFINTNTFFDYIILNELSKNVDGYRLSTFLYKDKNDKLNAGPIWDFNLGYGNANYLNAWEPFGLQLYADLGNDGWQNPFWWSALMADPAFANTFKCRWNILRERELSNQRIYEVTDSLVNLISDAATRNFQRWPILGQWVWPNDYVGNNYTEEVGWLKNWISQRLTSLNYSLPGECDGTIPVHVDEFFANVFPNPFNERLEVQIGSETNLAVQLQIFSSSGTMIRNQRIQVIGGINQIEINSVNLPRGMYIYRIFKGDIEIVTDKIIKI